MAENEALTITDEDLHRAFISLIAQQADVDENEVTEDWIMEQREKHIYPTARWTNYSDYGGYNLRGLRVLNRKEIDNIHSITESLFTQHVEE